MSHLTVNCPTCHKRLVYVPLDGLRLHYRCEEHGLLILTPLVVIQTDESLDVAPSYRHGALRTHDAA
jgi:hypothetical protein